MFLLVYLHHDYKNKLGKQKEIKKDKLSKVRNKDKDMIC